MVRTSASVAWIIGAGFSKPFGLPLASELHAAALSVQYKPYWDRQKQSSLRELDLVDVLAVCCGQESLANASLEETITFLSLARDALVASEYQRIPPRVLNSKLDAHTIDLIITELQERALLAIREQSNLVVPSAANDFEVLVKRLPETEGVITFNFDDLIERLAYAHGMRVSHNSDSSSGSLRISHPHGCAYWFRGEIDDERFLGDREALYSCTSPGGRRVTVYHATDPDHPIFDVANILPQFKRSQIEACVEMSYHKAVPWFLVPQWQLGSEIIANALTWVIVGYSFPTSDSFVRLWLMSWVMSHIQRFGKPPNIIIVDPSADKAAFGTRIKNVIPREAILIPSTIEESLKDGTLWDALARVGVGAH